MNRTFLTRTRHSSRPPETPLPADTTVLVVDDEPAVSSFVERALVLAGYRTAVASSGPEAIQVADGLASVNLLVTDERMPGMTGDELAQRLRKNDPALKVLYLTGFSDQLFDRKSALWADEAFLEKPATVRGLLEAVSLLLRGHVQ